MGPKPAKVPEKVVSKDETNIFYVEVKCGEVTEKLTVNSSCRLDIIADFVKRSFQKLLTEKVASLVASNCEDNGLIGSLKEFQTTLVSVTVMDLLFQDSQNVTVQWTEDPSKSGLQIFLPLVTYKLGVTKADKTVFWLST